MYNPTNIKKIIRRGLDGKMTAQDAAILKSARMIYEEDELLEMEMDVLEEMGGKRVGACCCVVDAAVSLYLLCCTCVS